MTKTPIPFGIRPLRTLGQAHPFATKQIMTYARNVLDTFRALSNEPNLSRFEALADIMFMQKSYPTSYSLSKMIVEAVSFDQWKLNDWFQQFLEKQLYFNPATFDAFAYSLDKAKRMKGDDKRNGQIVHDALVNTTNFMHDDFLKQNASALVDISSEEDKVIRDLLDWLKALPLEYEQFELVSTLKHAVKTY